MMVSRNRFYPVFRGCFCLFVSATLILGGCGKKEVEEQAPAVRPVKVFSVGGIESGNLTFPGTVEAGEKAVMSFRVRGRLIELPIKEGQDVEKGALIGRLDPKDYQIAVEEAQAQYQKAEADYRRYQTLYEKDAVPIADFDFRRSQRDVKKARLDEAKKDLSYTYLRAPFAGSIGNRYVENFMDVQANEKIVDLNDVTKVELKIDVPESIIKGVKAGMKAKYYAVFESVPDEKFPMEVKEVSNRADPATQTFKATFVMPQPETVKLLPGMTGQVEIWVSEADEAGKTVQDIIIPAIAVVGDESGKSYVWVVDETDMTVHKKEVKAGNVVGSDDMHIAEGLQSGEKIVTAGMMKLIEGMKVRFLEEK
jgi:RND family efflux transporter MFP subunit